MAEFTHFNEHGRAKMVDISDKKLTIRNFGVDRELDTNNLFSRFKKMNTDFRSTGLGLAIAKAITKKYQLQLNYTFSETHNFIISFQK